MKIIHIHWTYSFSPSSGALLGRIARWWFNIFLISAHAAGVKVVWTAHNVLPHEAVFDDDHLLRRLRVPRDRAATSVARSSVAVNGELPGMSVNRSLESGAWAAPFASGWISCVRGIIALYE